MRCKTKEIELFKALVPERQVIVVGFGAYTKVQDASADNDEGTVLMVGGNNRQNIRGLDQFCERIWPMVLNKLPDARFRIAGDVGKALCGLTSQMPKPWVRFVI